MLLMHILAPLFVALLFNASPAWAEESHDHSHDGSAPSQLQLNDGKKWETDQSLRDGMTKIKDIVASEIGAIHKNKLPEKRYGELSGQISAELDQIFKNCKLSPEADAMIHIILLQIIDGNKAMKSAPKLSDRRDGAIKIVKALGQYPKFFDHPDWKPIHH